MTADTRPAERRRPADLDDYDVDLDDIFGDLTPPPGQEGEGNKRKAPEKAGVEEEAPVAKRARAPRVKLDEQRLLSDEGIPRLRARAKGLKFKGKSHEFSDAARLLSFYQLWLDDLFPKAKFLDALAMVEKTGHKTTVLNRRRDWIAEERRKALGTSVEDDDRGEGDDDTGAPDPPGIEREKTPAPVEPGPEDDDIYTASPRRAPQATDPAGPPGQDEDDDALEALMMEADDEVRRGNNNNAAARPEADAFAEEEAAMAEMEGLW